MADRESYMRLALAEAEKAGARGEIPVGAVIVRGGEVIAAAGNTREAANDPTGHAEINAIRLASARLGWRLDGCAMYVTLEPCAMCAGAAVNARLDEVAYGAADPIAGCMGSRINLPHLELGSVPRVVPGVLAEECAALLADFFAARRAGTGLAP